MSNKFKLIIFDLGNVIFHISFEPVARYWAECTGLELDAVRERFSFEDQHKDFERGKISEEVYCECISGMLGANISFDDFVDGWNKIYLEPLPEINKVLSTLKGTHTIVALSNTNATHERVFPKMYKQELFYFDRLFYSHKMGYIKPEKEIYIQVLNEMNVKAEEAIFLDDKIENVEGASALGISGIHVREPKQMYAELDQLLQTNFRKLL